MHTKALKQLDNGRIGGYAVLFGDPEHTDLDGHYFTQETDYWLDKWDTIPMLYGHGTEGMKGSCVVGAWDTKRVDDGIGIWVEGQKDKAHKYAKYVQELIDAGVLKLSSDSIQHLLKGSKQANGATQIEQWPLVGVSLTPIPCEPRMMPVAAVKSAFKSIGVDVELEEEREMPSFKAMHLGDNAEMQATMSAVRSMNDTLMYDCLWDCVYEGGMDGEEAKPLADRLTEWKACVDEFRDISSKIIESVLTGVSPETPETAMKHIKAWKDAASKLAPLAGKSFGEELDGALAAISGVVERGAAIKTSRAAEGRTIGKNSLEKITQLSSALKSLETVAEPEPAEAEVVGLTDEAKQEILRLQAFALSAQIDTNLE